MSTPEPTPRATARQLIEEASSRGAHDDCMDKLLFTLEEGGYAILPRAAAGTGLREALAPCAECSLPVSEGRHTSPSPNIECRDGFPAGPNGCGNPSVHHLYRLPAWAAQALAARAVLATLPPSAPAALDVDRQPRTVEQLAHIRYEHPGCDWCETISRVLTEEAAEREAIAIAHALP